MSPNTRAYYRSALLCLRFIEERRPSKRRFGPEADALWSEFRGDLTEADRIDLLLRDADVQWPGAFGARTVFAKAGVAEDDAFGPEWEPLDPVDAAELFRDIERAAPAADAIGVLSAVAQAWDTRLVPFDAPPVDPADRFVVAGPSAVAALARAFVAGRDLDWADQVVCVATQPAHRQIAALAGALLNIAKRAGLVSAPPPATSAPTAPVSPTTSSTAISVSPAAPPSKAASVSPATSSPTAPLSPAAPVSPAPSIAVRPGARVVLSADASVEDAAYARALAGAPGAQVAGAQLAGAQGAQLASAQGAQVAAAQGAQGEAAGGARGPC